LQALGIVEYFPWETADNVSPQLSAYSHFIQANALSEAFSCFIDVDEFLAVPSNCNTVNDYFAKHGLFASDIGAVAVNQRVFGSSGRKEFDDDLVLKRFTMAASDTYLENRWCKSFFRPARTSHIECPHVVRLSAGRYVDVLARDLDPDEIRGGQTPNVVGDLRVNHYIVKSLEEFRIKQARGGVCGSSAADRAARYDEDFFFGRETRINAEHWRFDDTMLARVSDTAMRLKRAVGEQL